MKNNIFKWFSRDRLNILSTILVTIAIVFFFIADKYASSAEDTLLLKETLHQNIIFNLDNLDKIILEDKISTLQNSTLDLAKIEKEVKELTWSVNKLAKIKETSLLMQQTFPKYLYFKSLEDKYRLWGLILVLLSIVTNTWSLLKKTKK